MYKDKEAQKEAVRVANQRYRERQKGITQSNTDEGITWGEPVILSDGQWWYPEHNGYHPPECHCPQQYCKRPV